MKHWLITMALIGLITGGGATAAQGSAASDGSSKWIRYHQADVRVAAGQGCAFAVRAHVVYDREYYKVLSTFKDGTHQAELFRGPLIMRYKNLHTGNSVVQNLSGRGRVTYYRNGDFASITIVAGHFGTTIGPGNEQRRGLYRVGGRNSALTVRHDGHRQIALGRHGTLESICPRIHGKPGS